MSKSKPGGPTPNNQVSDLTDVLDGANAVREAYILYSSISLSLVQEGLLDASEYATIEMISTDSLEVSSRNANLKATHYFCLLADVKSILASRIESGTATGHEKSITVVTDYINLLMEACLTFSEDADNNVRDFLRSQCRSLLVQSGAQTVVSFLKSFVEQYERDGHLMDVVPVLNPYLALVAHFYLYAVNVLLPEYNRLLSHDYTSLDYQEASNDHSVHEPLITSMRHHESLLSSITHALASLTTRISEHGISAPLKLNYHVNCSRQELCMIFECLYKAGFFPLADEVSSSKIEIWTRFASHFRTQDKATTWKDTEGILFETLPEAERHPHHFFRPKESVLTGAKKMDILYLWLVLVKAGIAEDPDHLHGMKKQHSTQSTFLRIFQPNDPNSTPFTDVKGTHFGEKSKSPLIRRLFKEISNLRSQVATQNREVKPEFLIRMKEELKRLT